jgi:mono/diheme cytochrome c family protein
MVAATLAAPQRGGLEDGPTEGWSPGQEVSQEMILRGREVVLQKACGTCHGGMDDPTSEGWLAGTMSPAQEFPIGACAEQPGAEPCWITRPRNLTPHNTTGMGRFSERQIFNAIRYGLRPGETADVEITSTTPGEGNFPMSPKYLAPPMPWPAFRHMPDEDIWAIAAYLKHGVKPVDNRVQDSDGPPDFWESTYAESGHGPMPPAPFPQASEVMPEAGSVDMDRLMQGRQLVISIGCGDCHGGLTDPAAPGFLGGPNAPGQVFPVGPCLEDPNAPCFMQRPRNLTPDAETGLGNRTERQIFNALRFGLRPAGTPDMEITEASFPENPDFLGPGMPWIHLRHMPDDELWAIAHYLKNGVMPVANRVPDSDVPEGGWPGSYTPGLIGNYPAPPFPTAREVGG